MFDEDNFKIEIDEIKNQKSINFETFDERNISFYETKMSQERLNTHQKAGIYIGYAIIAIFIIQILLDREVNDYLIGFVGSVITFFLIKTWEEKKKKE